MFGLVSTAIELGFWSQLCISNIIIACIGKSESNIVTAPFWEWASIVHQQFYLCILGNLRSDWLETSIDEILAACSGKNNSDMLRAEFWKWVSIEHQ